MARQRTRHPEPPNGFVASAVSLPASDQRLAGSNRAWQQQAWQRYDDVSELRYLANWIGNVMSRATLHAAVRVGNALVPEESGPGRDAMDALFGGIQSQPQMIQQIGTNMTVSGEAYVTAREQSGMDLWHVLSSGKVTQSGKVLYGNYGGGTSKVELRDKKDLVVRLWTPHPTDPTEADAPTRSNLRTLSQIKGYDDHISAQLSSRLAGAGILFLPSEINFAAVAGADPNTPQATQFMMTLHEAMEAAKQNPEGPAAMVPIVVTAPGDELEKVQHMTFWTDLDDSVIEMRSAGIQRFAVGMDVPPETLMGNADQNHWNAWLSEEAAIKAHLEPRLAVMNAGLTTDYLRPSLPTGVNADDYFVIADTSGIRTRPNRSTEALELHDRGLINQEAILRETGFKAEDAMVGEEYMRWLLQRVSQGAVTPELTIEALRMLGVKLPETIVLLDSNGGQEQPTHTKTDTEVNDDGQVGGIPDPNDSETLLAASEVLVFRALEKAGNRLINANRGTAVTGSVWQAYMELTGEPGELLAGAWECAYDVLGHHTANVSGVVDILDFYTRGLISQKRVPSKMTLRKLLEAQQLEATPVLV